MSSINPLIFRAYDIRGIATPTNQYPTPDLTEATVEQIGLATGTYLQQTYQTKTMAVGRDNRLHSEQLQTAFIKGIQATGIEVTNLGLTSSPMVYFTVCNSNFDSGVNITASHNPKQYNGIKIVRQNGISVCDQELKQIYNLTQTQNYKISSNPKPILNFPQCFTNYKNFILNQTKLHKPLTIVVDSGNGITGIYIPKLLRELGCNVHELYTELDGNFPNHEANPEEEHNMQDLAKAVRDLQADFGLGFDGDGDRIGLVDEHGKHYPAEYLLMFFSRNFLKQHPGEKIIFDVKVSNNLINDIKNSGGIPIMSKTGHSFIEEKIKQENASLAGENSGHLFFGPKFYNYFGFDDAMYAAAKFAEQMSQIDQKFSQLFTNLPKLFSTPEIKIPCSDQSKFEVIQQLQQHFLQTHDCIIIDGVRVNFDQNSWGAIRASNTTPCLTARFEADSTEKMHQIKQLFFDQLKQFPTVNLTNL